MVKRSDRILFDLSGCAMMELSQAGSADAHDCLWYRLIRATTCAPENGHFLDLMGRVYWAMGDAGRSDKNKAFTHFLKVCNLPSEQMLALVTESM